MRKDATLPEHIKKVVRRFDKTLMSLAVDSQAVEDTRQKVLANLEQRYDGRRRSSSSEDSDY